MKPPGFRGIFREDDLARAVYSEAAGIGRKIPSAVAVPVDADDVVALVVWAAATGTALTPRGSGSSMAGGAIGGGIIVDLSQIKHLSKIDDKARMVWVDPGVVWSTLDVAARRKGLRLPVDPSSGGFCTLGGMVATNASGARTLRHGSTRAWVNAVDCVFSDGDRAILTRGEAPPTHIKAVKRLLQDAHAAIIAGDRKKPIRHEGVRKESSGYAIHDYAEKADIVDLIVGSEGTLALIVAIRFSLAPVAGATSSVLGSFSSLAAAASAATKAGETGASACEMLDKSFLAVAAQGGNTNEKFRERVAGAEAILLAEVEGDTSAAAAAAARKLAAAFSAAGATACDIALTPEAEREVWDLRHAASPILAALEGSTSMQFIEDGAVPLRNLPAYVEGVRNALGARHLGGVIFGHAGDAHVHVNPLIDVMKGDWRSEVSGLLDEVVGLTGRLGGTLSGEHGDGTLRAPLLGRVWPRDAIKAFAMVKKAFDPANIFNPGVKVPLPGQLPLADIKYDPDLKPLPDEARAALDHLTKARDYGAFRLSLVGGSSSS